MSYGDYLQLEETSIEKGRTNLLEKNEKYGDKGFTEITYEYATKCLNMLLHDLCNHKDSYIVRDFRKNGVLEPQNIIDIRNQFGDIVKVDDDINVYNVMIKGEMR